MVRGSGAASGRAQGLQVEDLRHFIAAGDGSRYRPRAHYMGKVAHASVQVGQQRAGDKVEGGEDDQNRLGLPLFRGEFDLIEERCQLRLEWLLFVELGHGVDGALDGLSGNGFELRDLFLGKGVGEVEEEHGTNQLKFYGNVWMRSALKQPFEITLLADNKTDNRPGQTIELLIFVFRNWHSSVSQD